MWLQILFRCAEILRFLKKKIIRVHGYRVGELPKNHFLCAARVFFVLRHALPTTTTTTTTL